MYKKILVLLLLLALCAVWAVCAETATEAPEAEATPEPTPEEFFTAAGYVYVSTATEGGWLPLPEEEDCTYKLHQMTADGEELINVIHLTKDGVYMEESTCDGQDCVKQGEVTLENRKDRILSNMILCLPNQVSLELYSREEMLEMAKSDNG